MFKLKRSLLAATAIAFLGCTYSCDNDDPKEIEIYGKGVWKAEVQCSGEVGEASPIVICQAIYGEGADKVLYNNKGQLIGFEGAVGYNYDEEPEAFSLPIVVSTSNDALDLRVNVYPSNIKLPTEKEAKIKATIKGYYNGRLVKTITKEISNDHTKDYSIDILIGGM